MQAQQRARFHKIARILATLAALGQTLSARLSHAGDWPQILGPARNGVAATDEKIVDAFPKGGPRTVWEHKVGQGYAGVAVADGRLVVFHRLGDQEIVEALDPLTGKRHWKQAFPATYSGGVNSDQGPRCVPLVHRGNVYLFGAASDLHSVSLDNGAKRWSRALATDYKIPESYFGAGSTPIVEGDQLLVNVGARGHAGIVAFSLADGKTLWQATDEQASYSSPVAGTLEGVRHVIFVTRLTTLSVDPRDGQVRWKFPFGERGPTVNAATPQVLDSLLFLSASYGIGAVCRKIGNDETSEVWANHETMSSQSSTSVPYNGFLYGVDGRQDQPPSRLRCFDPATGKVQWTKEEFPVANLLVADGKLVMSTADGSLILASADSSRYRELGRAKVLTATNPRVPALALPALSNGLLYVRDSQTLKCVDLRRAN
jgi:outer membrane protein assembly factor BamB